MIGWSGQMRNSVWKAKNTVTFMKYAILILIFVFCIYPLLWIFISAFKTKPEIFINPWGLPVQPHFQNLHDAWILGNFGRVLLNSLFVTISSVALSFVCASPATYFFLIGKFKGKVLYYPILLSLVIPPASLMIPMSFLTARLGIIDTYLALIFPYAALHMPLCMFIMREFFATIPSSLREAAVIDGASDFEVLRSVYLPISKPAIYSAITLMSIFIWNEFTLGVVLVTEPSVFTIPLGLNVFAGAYSYEYPLVFSSLIIVNLPLILILILLQKHFVRGIVSGALKE